MLKLTPPRIETLSDISRDIAQVLFAALFIDPITRGSVDIISTGLGLTLSLLAWSTSLILRQSF